MTPLWLWFVVVFLIGLHVGRFLNRCITRVPYEKSLLWPLAPRCGSCLRPARWRDGVPVLSYLLRRGRCRACGARQPFRYPLVELGTGLALAGLFHAVAVENWL